MYGLGTRYVAEGRSLFRDRVGHVWWTPLVRGAPKHTACPRCWREGEPINEEDVREEDERVN